MCADSPPELLGPAISTSVAASCLQLRRCVVGQVQQARQVQPLRWQGEASMLRLLGLEDAAREAAEHAAGVERQRSLARSRRSSSRKAPGMSFCMQAASCVLMSAVPGF